MRHADEDYEALYRAVYPRLVGVVACIACSREEAEDAVQEAFARLYLQWDHVRHYDNPEAWIRTVAIRRVVSGKRRANVARRGHERMAGLSVPTTEHHGPELVSLVSMLSDMSIEHRVVIFLYYVVDLSIDDIASELELAAGTVKSRLARARSLLSLLVHEERIGND